MTAATATSRPSPASPFTDDLDADATLDATPAAQEHRLSGRWADAEFSAFPKFTVWRLNAFISRSGLAKALVEAGLRARVEDAKDLLRRIEDVGQPPSIVLLGALVRASEQLPVIRNADQHIVFEPRLTRLEVLDLFTANGSPIL